MGKQYTKAIFVGTCANLNGYVDDGKPVARLVDRKDRRHAGALAASKAFGKVSKAAAQLWRKIPQGMRRLGGEGAFNEWVSACHGLRNEGSFHWDWEQLEGMAFGDGVMGVDSDFPRSPRSLPEFSGHSGRLRDAAEGICCWKAPTRTAMVAGIRLGKLDLSGALASVRRAMKPYREGVDAQWRLGAMPRRDGHYDLGMKFNPYRGAAFRYEGDARDRAWNERHAKGIYKGVEPEIVDHGWGDAGGGFGRGHTVWEEADEPRMPKRWDNFRAPKQKGVALVKGEIRVRFWLQLVDVDGRAVPWSCTDWWNLDAGEGPVLDLIALKERLSGLPEGRDVLVFAGVEVSEKRVRHWVRLPWACGLSVVLAGPVDAVLESLAVGQHLYGHLAVRGHRMGRLPVRGNHKERLALRENGGITRHRSGP